MHKETVSGESIPQQQLPFHQSTQPPVSERRSSSSDQRRGWITEPVQEGGKAAVFPLRLTEPRCHEVGSARRRRPPSGAACTFS